MRTNRIEREREANESIVRIFAHISSAGVTLHVT